MDLLLQNSNAKTLDRDVLTEIPHVNAASPKDYKRFYTDKSHDLIAEKCEKDIAYFNYRF